MIALLAASEAASPSWLVLVAAGAAGSVLTMLARYAAIPSQVRHHDRQVADIDQDIDVFAADEISRLMDLVFRIRFPNQELPKVAKPVIAYECAQAVGASMQLYRDWEKTRLREYRELIASEGWAHRAWRKLHPRRREIAKLCTPTRAAKLLDLWPSLVPHAHKVGEDFDPRVRSIRYMTTLLDEYLSDPRATE